MANDELNQVDELDVNLVKNSVDKCLYYFGTSDDWCPIEYSKILKEKIVNFKLHIDKLRLEHAFVVDGAEE
jgi:hypothetical protein